MNIKAITLWQPWASLIALGVKTIETRGWKAPDSLIGQRIAIHAAQRSSGYGWLGVEDAEWRYEPDCMGRVGDDGVAHMQYALPRGHVVCTGVLADCVPIVDVETCEWDGSKESLTACAHAAIDGQVIIHTPGFGRYHTTVVVEQAYGDYTPGRFAWLLADVEPLHPPIPATGRQGIWEWTP